MSERKRLKDPELVELLKKAKPKPKAVEKPEELKERGPKPG